MSESGGLRPVVALGALADLVAADASTPIPFGGTPVNIACVKASRPAWLNAGGAIILPGLYEILIALSTSVAPTTPGVFVSSIGATGGAVDVWEAVNFAGIVQHSQVVALASGDLPLPTTVSVTGETDATAIMTARVSVWRLAALTT